MAVAPMVPPATPPQEQQQQKSTSLTLVKAYKPSALVDWESRSLETEAATAGGSPRDGSASSVSGGQSSSTTTLCALLVGRGQRFADEIVQREFTVYMNRTSIVLVIEAGYVFGSVSSLWAYPTLPFVPWNIPFIFCFIGIVIAFIIDFRAFRKLDCASNGGSRAGRRNSSSDDTSSGGKEGKEEVNNEPQEEEISSRLSFASGEAPNASHHQANEPTVQRNSTSRKNSNNENLDPQPLRENLTKHRVIAAQLTQVFSGIACGWANIFTENSICVHGTTFLESFGVGNGDESGGSDETVNNYTPDELNQYCERGIGAVIILCIAITYTVVGLSKPTHWLVPHHLTAFVVLALSQIAIPRPSWSLEDYFVFWIVILFLSIASAGLHVVLYRSGMSSFRQEITLEVARRIAKRRQAEVEQLLVNMLPLSALDRLCQGQPVSDFAEDASVLFSDIREFTSWSTVRSPKEVAQMLNVLTLHIDFIAAQRGIEKIKTVGDAYWAVAGIPEACPDHAERICNFGSAMQLLVTMHNKLNPHWRGIQIRIGVHSGPLHGGILGSTQLSYEVFGETSTTANRVEALGVPGYVVVTEETMRYLEVPRTHWPPLLDYLEVGLEDVDVEQQRYDRVLTMTEATEDDDQDVAPTVAAGQSSTGVPAPTEVESSPAVWPPQREGVLALFRLPRLKDERSTIMDALLNHQQDSVSTGTKPTSTAANTTTVILGNIHNNSHQHQQQQHYKAGQQQQHKGGKIIISEPSQVSEAQEHPSSQSASQAEEGGTISSGGIVRNPLQVSSSSSSNNGKAPPPVDGGGPILPNETSSQFSGGSQVSGGRSSNNNASSKTFRNQVSKTGSGARAQASERLRAFLKLQTQKMLTQHREEQELKNGSSTAAGGVGDETSSRISQASRLSIFSLGRSSNSVGGSADDAENWMSGEVDGGGSQLRKFVEKTFKRRWRYVFYSFKDELTESGFRGNRAREQRSHRLFSRGIVVCLVVLVLVLSAVNGASSFSSEAGICFGLAIIFGLVDTLLCTMDLTATVFRLAYLPLFQVAMQIITIFLCIAGCALLPVNAGLASNNTVWIYFFGLFIVGTAGNTGLVNSAVSSIIYSILTIPPALIPHAKSSTFSTNVSNIVFTAPAAVVIGISFERQLRHEFIQKKVASMLRDRQEVKSLEQEALLRSIIPRHIVHDIMEWMKAGFDPSRPLVQELPMVNVAFVQLDYDQVTNSRSPQTSSKNSLNSSRRSSSGGGGNQQQGQQRHQVVVNNGNTSHQKSGLFESEDNNQQHQPQVHDEGNNKIDDNDNDDHDHEPLPPQTTATRPQPPTGAALLTVDVEREELPVDEDEASEQFSAALAATTPSDRGAGGGGGHVVIFEGNALNSSSQEMIIGGGQGGGGVEQLSATEERTNSHEIVDQTSPSEEEMHQRLSSGGGSASNNSSFLAQSDQHWLQYVHTKVDKILLKASRKAGGGLMNSSAVIKIKTVGDVVMLAGPFEGPPPGSERTQQNPPPTPSASSSTSFHDNNNSSGKTQTTTSNSSLSHCNSKSIPESYINRSSDLMFDVVQEMRKVSPVRAGLHCGELVGAVLGTNRLCFDIFGDTVNTTSRVMTSGKIGDISVSTDFHQRLEKAPASSGTDSSAGARYHHQQNKNFKLSTDDSVNQQPRREFGEAFPVKAKGKGEIKVRRWVAPDDE